MRDELKNLWGVERHPTVYAFIKHTTFLSLMLFTWYILRDTYLDYLLKDIKNTLTAVDFIRYFILVGTVYYILHAAHQSLWLELDETD